MPVRRNLRGGAALFHRGCRSRRFGDSPTCYTPSKRLHRCKSVHNTSFNNIRHISFLPGKKKAPGSAFRGLLYDIISSSRGATVRLAVNQPGKNFYRPVFFSLISSRAVFAAGTKFNMALNSLQAYSGQYAQLSTPFSRAQPLTLQTLQWLKRRPVSDLHPSQLMSSGFISAWYSFDPFAFDHPFGWR